MRVYPSIVLRWAYLIMGFMCIYAYNLALFAVLWFESTFVASVAYLFHTWSLDTLSDKYSVYANIDCVDVQFKLSLLTLKDQQARIVNGAHPNKRNRKSITVEYHGMHMHQPCHHSYTMFGNSITALQQVVFLGGCHIGSYYRQESWCDFVWNICSSA